jgi:antirestriction protein
MTNQYHAQPYDMTKTGFYFTDEDSYNAGVEASGAEEFEIQFIDGDSEKACLFNACKISQATIVRWFDDLEDLSDADTVALFYLVSECGYDLEEALDQVDDVAISECDLEEAASQFFDECYLHEIPEHVRSYIDYEAFARDCQIGGDMCEFEFAKRTYTCTNASCI